MDTPDAQTFITQRELEQFVPKPLRDFVRTLPDAVQTKIVAWGKDRDADVDSITMESGGDYWISYKTRKSLGGFRVKPEELEQS